MEFALMASCSLWAMLLGIIAGMPALVWLFSVVLVVQLGIWGVVLFFHIKKL